MEKLCQLDLILRPQKSKNNNKDNNIFYHLLSDKK